MAKPLRCKATLEPRGPAAAIVLTDEQVAAPADGPKTPAVKVTVNGAYTFDGRVARMRGENLMAGAGAADMFTKLAPSHRKEYVRWITEAKRPSSKRIAEAVQTIGQGKPRR